MGVVVITDKTPSSQSFAETDETRKKKMSTKWLTDLKQNDFIWNHGNDCYKFSDQAGRELATVWQRDDYQWRVAIHPAHASYPCEVVFDDKNAAFRHAEDVLRAIRYLTPQIPNRVR